ncbi:CHAT domain-containing protein [Sorangium sp. So ce381]|uniref:CHAT domain-containing protein n=1 Tax=Sorangium sp. So ce381 TaxID=3133307 RepID=UPI003F5CA126
MMAAERPTGFELRWLQPLRGDEIAPLVANVVHSSPEVAKHSLSAVVRLSLTPRAWSLVAANTRLLLDRAATFDEPTLAEILRNATRIPVPSLRAVLLDLLEKPLAEVPRQHLISALARSEEPAVVPALLRQLRSSDPEVRVVAARDLSIFRGLDRDELQRAFAGELHPAVRFWIALALAVGGAPDALLQFFRERRLRYRLKPPYINHRAWQIAWQVESLAARLRKGRLGKLLGPVDVFLRQRGLLPGWEWEPAISVDGSEQFVLHERADLLSDEIRRSIGRIPLSPTDARATLQHTLKPQEPHRWPGAETRAPERVASETEIAGAKQTVERWIERAPDWAAESQELWDRRTARGVVGFEPGFAQVDPRLRGRAVTALFVRQFARMRDPVSAEPFLYRHDEFAISDGGNTMCVLVMSIIEGAAGIDVAELFRLYWENEQAPVYPGIQLAAAASYASPREVLVATELALRSGSPEHRRAAAEFIELVRRYVGQGIPGWGGEGGAPETESDHASAEHRETLSYDPLLEAPALVSPEQSVKIRVDLRRAAGLAGQLRLEDIASPWRALTVDVSIVAPGIRIQAGRESGVITLYPDGTSLPFETEGEVAPEEGQKGIRLCALFSFRGRNCGWADLRITLDAAHPRGSPIAASIEIDLDAEPPALTLQMAYDELADVYVYNVLTREELQHLPGMPDEACGSVRLQRDDVAQCRRIFATTVAMDAGQARSTLQGLGDLLYERLPKPFREAYQALRERLGEGFDIQVISDDPGFPWELARPCLDGSSTTLLCEAHPIARWPSGRIDSRRVRLRRGGTILTVAPAYKGKESLPRTKEEAAWLVEELGATRLKPITRDGFLGALRRGDPPISVLHVAGHGTFNRDAPLLSKLGLGSQYLTVADIRGTPKQALEDALVLLNICEAGAADGHFGHTVVSLAESFLHRGAAAVIAPIWTVGDGEALEMLKRCLPRMLSGTPIAEVLRDARYGDGMSIDPLAYLLWGDVHAAFGPQEADDAARIG